jgi:hypothetical protein
MQHDGLVTIPHLGAPGYRLDRLDRQRGGRRGEPEKQAGFLVQTQHSVRSERYNESTENRTPRAHAE